MLFAKGFFRFYSVATKAITRRRTTKITTIKLECTVYHDVHSESIKKLKLTGTVILAYGRPLHCARNIIRHDGRAHHGDKAFLSVVSFGRLPHPGVVVKLRPVQPLELVAAAAARGRVIALSSAWVVQSQPILITAYKNT